MVLKFYVDLMSQPCRSLFILLKLCNIPFEIHHISIGNQENLTEEFRKISKFQKLPVISNDGFILTESVAILRYLSKVKKLPEEWYPHDPESQAKVDEYLEWQHLNTRLLTNLFFQRKWLHPKLFGKITSPERLTIFEKNMSDCYNDIEKVWLTPGPFITGDKISAADIWAACEIQQSRVAGYDPRKGRPVLSAWLDRVREITNPYYDEAHYLLNELVESELESDNELISKL